MYIANQVTCDLRAEGQDANTQGMGDFMAGQDQTNSSLSVMSLEGRDIVADNEFSTHRVVQLQDIKRKSKACI